jgi:hypothetical protein
MSSVALLRTRPRLRDAFAALALILATGATSQAAGPSFAASAAYRNLVKNSGGIKTLSSVVDVQTKLRGFPPITLRLHGHSYYEAPLKSATVFENVPGPLKKMLSDSPSIAPAAAWGDVYEVTIESDVAGKSTFHLVPKDAASNLDHIDALVNDASGLVEEYDFESKNGASTTTYNSYTVVSGYPLVTSQTGTSHGHGYNADVTTSFSNYEINGQLPAGAFDKE